MPTPSSSKHPPDNESIPVKVIQARMDAYERDNLNQVAEILFATKGTQPPAPQQQPSEESPE